MDGKTFTPKDVTGKVVDPFIVDGTTYLPVRAVAEALGKEVSWDSETRTVSLGEPAGLAPWADLHPYCTTGDTVIFDGSDPEKTFTAAGTEHAHGVMLKDNSNVVFSTNGKYKTMKFTVVTYNNDSSIHNPESVDLDVYVGDVKNDTIELHLSDTAKEYTIPVNYASNVNLILRGGPWTKYALFDISFE